MGIFERYLNSVGGDPDAVLHSASDIATYMDCPMRWFLDKVHKQTPRRLTQTGLFADLLKQFVADMLMFRSKEFLFLDQLCDVWGKYASNSILYETGDDQLRRSILIDGAEFIAGIFEDIFEPEVADASVTCAVYVNPGVQQDGAMKVHLTAIYEDPARILLVTDRVVARRYWKQDPEFYALAAVNKRIQRSMGRGKDKTPRPIVLSTSEKKIHRVPADLDFYQPGPHWARVLECMDILGAYPRPGTRCKTCPFEAACSPDKADVRKMKTSGKNTNTSRAHLRARNDRKQANDPDLQ